MSDTTAAPATTPSSGMQLEIRYIIIIAGAALVILLLLLLICVCWYCRYKREQEKMDHQLEMSANSSTLRKKWLDVPTNRTVAGSSMRQVIMKRGSALPENHEGGAAAAAAQTSGATYNEIDKETSHVVYQTGYSSKTTSHHETDSGTEMSPFKGSPAPDEVVVDLTHQTEAATSPAPTQEITVVEISAPPQGHDNPALDLSGDDEYILVPPMTNVDTIATDESPAQEAPSSRNSTEPEDAGEYIYSSLLEQTRSKDPRPSDSPAAVTAASSAHSTPVPEHVPAPPPKMMDDDSIADETDAMPLPPAHLLATEPPAHSPTPPPVASATTYSDLSRSDDDALMRSVWLPRADIQIIEK